jgi:hypothetical protein
MAKGNSFLLNGYDFNLGFQLAAARLLHSGFSLSGHVVIWKFYILDCLEIAAIVQPCLIVFKNSKKQLELVRLNQNQLFDVILNCLVTHWLILGAGELDPFFELYALHSKAVQLCIIHDFASLAFA